MKNSINKNYSIGVLGLWHLGSVVSACWSSMGFKTIGYDDDIDLVKSISLGIAPVHEPRLNSIIKKNVVKKNLHFSSSIKDIEKCDIFFLTYDTPVDINDNPNCDILIEITKKLKKHVNKRFTLIVSSQVPIGTCSKLKKIIGAKCGIAYIPENLQLGNAINCYLKPDRNIIGTNDKYTEKKILGLFNNIKTKNYFMSIESAELVKHGINSFLATSVVFSNLLSNICEENKANIDDVIKGLKSDSRIGKKAYLNPGIGFSGGTLGRDLRVLSSLELKSNSKKKKFFKNIHELNLQRKRDIIKKISEIVKNNKVKNLGFLGMTYKKNTSTLRRSIPLEIATHFSLKYIVKIHDPKADWSSYKINKRLKITSNLFELTKDSEILILLTGWDDYIKFDWKKIKKNLKNNIFYDPQKNLDKSKMIKQGFNYITIGQ